MARLITKECQVSKIPEKLGVNERETNLIAFNDIPWHVWPECDYWILDEEIIFVM